MKSVHTLIIGAGISGLTYGAYWMARNIDQQNMR